MEEVNSVVQLLGATRKFENKIFSEIQDAIKSTLLSPELINKLMETISENSRERTEKQIGEILDSAAGTAVEKIREVGFLTIDSTLLLQEKGQVWHEQYNCDQSVKDFLDRLWFKLNGHVPAYTYGKKWILRDQQSGHIFNELTEYWATLHNIDRSKQTISEAGIKPGLTIQVVSVKRPVTLADWYLE